MDLLHLFGFVSSVLIGVRLGMIGSGGSILTLPVLVYLLGISPVVSTVYSLFVVGTTSLVGSVSYMQKHLVHYRAAAVFSIPSFLAVYLSRRYGLLSIPDPVFASGTFALSKDLFVMLFFALIMLAAAVSMIRSGKAAATAEEGDGVFSDGAVAFGGLVVGALTGIVGAGGGFLIIPVLVLVAHLPMRQAVGTSLLIIAAKSLFGFAGDVPGVAVNWSFLLGFTLLSVAGIWLGAGLARFIPCTRLKQVFGWFVLAMSLCILVRETVFHS